MTDTPIPAATIVLLRDEPQFEVLMIQRHADIGFAGGALVFPGGRVDPGDHSSAWADYCQGLHEQPVMAAGQVAAIREAFEETGVLFARDASDSFVSGDQAKALGEFRAAVEEDDAEFLAMIKRENLRLACDALCFFAHWIAPPGMHKRFDTLFFAARFPDGQSALEDGNEATETLWISPANAVTARAEGERKIIFPTIRNLDLLSVSTSTEEVIEFAGRRPIRPVTPVMVKRNNEPYLQIPDDDLGYPVIEEPLSSSGRI